MITVLYFARLREALGTGSEQIALAAGGDLATLQNAGRPRRGVGAGIRAASIRAAVNQEMANPDTPVNDGDEVAFFRL